ncbi:MAG: cyclic nucleotide-binding domain-containing protein, partial [Pseudomonadota bacterium]
MASLDTSVLERLIRVPPFNHLDGGAHADLADRIQELHVEAGETLFTEGKPLEGIYLLERGAADIFHGDEVISQRGPGDLMGERGLLRGGRAMLTARITEPTDLLLLPAQSFYDLTARVPAIGTWFGRSAPSPETPADPPHAVGLMSIQVSDIMVRELRSCDLSASARDVARMMRQHTISSV